MDAALQSCTSSAAVGTRINGVCNGPVPTRGLVGLLSNTLAGTAWVDEYRGVNATVKGGAATSEKGGVTFSGAGAGAEWPVGSRGQNQPYYFANNGFTLVASVMIHTVPEEDTPLLGVSMNDTAGTVLLGVTYTQDKKWKVTVGGKSRSLSTGDVTWEPGTAYQVILQMDTGDELSVYVDGDEIYNGEDAAEAVEKLFTPHRISHFYVGDGSAAAGTKTSHHVTVASALLYNEALTGDEIRKLAGSKVALGGPSAGKESRELQAAPPVPTSEGGEPVPEAKLEDGRGEQQTEDGERTEGPQEKEDGAADEVSVREEHLPAVLGSGGANASPQQPVNAPPHATGTPKVEDEQSQEAEAGSAGGPAPREEDAGVPDPGAAPPSSDVEVASEPTGDSLHSQSEEQHQQEEKEAATQLSQGTDREAGEASTPSNPTPNSGAEEEEKAEGEKEKKELEEVTEDSDGALASPPLSAPAAAGAPRPGATEQAVGAQTSERQREPSPPADGAATAGQVGDGQAQQGAPSHAPETDGGVPSASAAPTG
ncbi:trans-sialidase, partial [Trypanosoma conorhini]